MSKTLYLLRHAKAAAGTASIDDFERPLDAKGISDCALTGFFFKTHDIHPDRVLCSTAKRTRQTLELVQLADGNSFKTDFIKRLYMASAGEMIAQLRVLHDTVKSAMVVAHNPGIHECALRLCKNGAPSAVEAIETNYPTSGLAIIHCDISNWQQLAPECGFLEDFISPKEG